MILRFQPVVSFALLVVCLVPSIGGGQDLDSMPAQNVPETSQRDSLSLRVATFNVSLYGDEAGEVLRRLETGSDRQAIQLATVIRTIRPDVLLLCEIDHDEDAQTLNAFVERYLREQGNAKEESTNELGSETLPINYPYRWSIPTNTGLLSDQDLDSDGDVELPTDAHGFGKYRGQYAMAILSRYPILSEAIRSFQTLRWSNMPGALRPFNPESNEPYHPDAVWKSLRLSSKNHVDIPIRIPVGASSSNNDGASSRVLHWLACHPTPPVFDGKEDRNGKRNHDEIRFWSDYISDGKSVWIVDDQGNSGGLGGDRDGSPASFVIAGDLNSDPKEGDSLRGGIRNLLAHPRVQDTLPTSPQHGIATARFGRNPIRVDYVLPSSDWHVINSGVVWPDAGTALGKATEASDHRMVWVDLRLQP